MKASVTCQISANLRSQFPERERFVPVSWEVMTDEVRDVVTYSGGVRICPTQKDICRVCLNNVGLIPLFCAERNTREIEVDTAPIFA